MSEAFRVVNKRAPLDESVPRPRVPHPRQAEVDEIFAAHPDGTLVYENGRAVIEYDLTPEPMEVRRIAALSSNPTTKVDGINTLYSDRRLKRGEEIVKTGKARMMSLNADDLVGKWTNSDE